MNHIPSSSPTRLSTYEQCKLRAWLQYGEKIPDPNPSPAADRGTMIHKLAEDWLTVKNPDTPLPKELIKFDKELHKLLTLDFETEGEWGYDKEWEPTDWRTAWLRLKLDVCVFLSPTEILVIDFKTGARWGNEIKHAEQLLFYAAAVAARFPSAETIHTELWYLDQDEITQATYPRQKALTALARFNTRLVKMTKPQDFLPNPNVFSCKYCPYGPWGTGHCTKGKRV